MHGKEPVETKKVPLQTKTYKKKMGDKVKEILRKQIKKSKTIRKLEDQYRKQNMQLVGLSKKDNRKRIGKKIPRTNAQKCLEEKVMNLQKQRAPKQLVQLMEENPQRGTSLEFSQYQRWREYPESF